MATFAERIRPHRGAQKTRKITCAKCCRRNRNVRDRLRVLLPRQLRIDKEEQLVFLDGPTERPAELIEPQDWHAVREIVAGIEVVVL